MSLIPNSDVWYTTFTMVSNHRFWYRFTPTSNISSADTRARPDPLNRHRFRPPVARERPASAIKTDSPYMDSSILVLPETPASPWVDPRPGVAPGRVEERAYQSQLYRTSRRIWIYTPPKRTALTGVLICFWGLDYQNEIPLPTILDNLLSQHKIPPLAAIFLDNTGDRFQDFQSATKVTESLSRELIPWAFYIDVGGDETTAAGGVFKDGNIRLRDVLLKKGYELAYNEVPGGEHEFMHWRSTIADGLIFLTAGWK